MQNETYSSNLTLTICGGTYMLDPWELMRWIVKKHFEYGKRLKGRANYHGTELRGVLLPHSIDRTQTELTRSTLVDLITNEGLRTFNCKYLTHIEITHP